MSNYEWTTFKDKDGLWMICKRCQSDYVLVSEETVADTLPAISTARMLKLYI